jgi:hypothetical protein
MDFWSWKTWFVHPTGTSQNGKKLYSFTFQICYLDSINDEIQDDKLIWRIFYFKTLII